MEENFDELKKMLDKVPDAERDALFNKVKGEIKAVSDTFDEEEDDGMKHVLIVDDLGVITFQLETMFAKNGYEVTVSQEIYDAIAKYRIGHFHLVIIDLFIPTEREGFLLLDELKKMAKIKKKDLKIGVITASTKKEHKIACRQRGVAFYMEKTNNWQKELLEICKNL